MNDCGGSEAEQSERVGVAMFSIIKRNKEAEEADLDWKQEKRNKQSGFSAHVFSFSDNPYVPCSKRLQFIVSI